MILTRSFDRTRSSFTGARRRVGGASLAAALVAWAGLLVAGCTEHVEFKERPAGRKMEEKVLRMEMKAQVERKESCRLVLTVKEEADIQVETYSLAKRIEVRTYRQIVTQRNWQIFAGAALLLIVIIVALASPDEDEGEETTP